MQEAVIVSGVRTPTGKAPKGTLRNTRPEYLGTLAIKEAMSRAPGLDPGEIEDVVLGCSFPEGKQGMNMARLIALKAGLPVTAAGQTVNRFCSSGLQAIAIAAQSIMVGWTQAAIAGGVESMSAVPMGGFHLSPDPGLLENMPEAYLGMGITAENVANKYHVSREDQDAFAVQSHQHAAAAISEGKFKEETVPVPVVSRFPAAGGGIKKTEILFEEDEGVRPDTNREALAKLRPAFKLGGSVTAGNSSQTSDGAAVVVLTSAKKADSLGLKPLGFFRSFAVAGVEPELMGIGPIAAIPKALKLAGITKDDVDLFELNEAFASQSLAVIRELELDQAKVNVNGGAIALGHPLGCTGGKLTVTLLHEMQRRNSRYGVVTMCIGGGMGAAAVFERV